MSGLPEWIRYVNAALYLLAFFALGSSLVKRRRLISRRTKRVGWWIYAGLAIGSYASLYAAQHSLPLPWYVGLVTVQLTGLLVALAMHPSDDDDIPGS